MDTQNLKNRRQAQAKVSNRKLDMAPFKAVLGEDLPDFQLNKLGKYRLMQALQYKYGAGYKNVPAANKLLMMFEREMKLAGLGV